MKESFITDVLALWSCWRIARRN